MKRLFTFECKTGVHKCVHKCKLEIPLEYEDRPYATPKYCPLDEDEVNWVGVASEELPATVTDSVSIDAATVLKSPCSLHCKSCPPSQDRDDCPLDIYDRVMKKQ